MSEISTKPYLLRAIYEWCTDNGYTPYMAVTVDGNTRVPMEFVKNGEIVLNISFTATSGLKMENDLIRFSARFGGVSRNIEVPVANVMAIYARENGQGMAFEIGSEEQDISDDAMDDAAFDEPMDTPAAPVLSSVPAADIPERTDDGGDEDPTPPRKAGRPTLTRVK